MVHMYNRQETASWYPKIRYKFLETDGNGIMFLLKKAVERKHSSPQLLSNSP